MRLPPAWRVWRMEMCDPFGWHEIDATTLLLIYERLKNFETMALGKIIGPTGSHMVPVYKLCKEARDRIQELRLDDIEELLSLRVTGVQRIWGILDSNIVTLLWWDPDHLVCPSLLKNT